MTPEKLYTAIEVAEMFHYRIPVSPSELRKMGYRMSQIIPGSIKLGKYRMWPDTALETYIENKKVKG